MQQQMPEKVAKHVSKLRTTSHTSDTLKAPFFCIHPLTGVGEQVYASLANHLDDRDFYAISSPILFNSQTNIEETYSKKITSLEDVTRFIKSIDDLAHQYIKFIMAFQPKGPYCLGGLSFGGLVAFRMAVLLSRPYEEDGYNQEVPFLGIFDTVFNNISSWDKSTLVKNLISTIQLIIADHPAIKAEVLSYEDLIKLDSKEQIIFDAFTKIKLDFNKIQIQDIDILTQLSNQAKQLKELLLSSMLHFFAAAQYNIGQDEMVNSITYFIATDNPTIDNKEIELNKGISESIDSWKKHSRTDINVVPIKGNHINIVETYQLADELKKHLNEIDVVLKAGQSSRMMLDLLTQFASQENFAKLFIEKLTYSAESSKSLIDALEAVKDRVSFAVKTASLNKNMQEQSIVTVVEPHSPLLLKTPAANIAKEDKQRIKQFISSSPPRFNFSALKAKAAKEKPESVKSTGDETESVSRRSYF